MFGQGCHNAFLQPCHTTLAQPCILKLSQCCDKVVRTLSQSKSKSRVACIYTYQLLTVSSRLALGGTDVTT